MKFSEKKYAYFIVRFLTLGTILFFSLPVSIHAAGLPYRIVKVDKALNPEDITKEPLTYYHVNAGKDQNIKAGDIFRVERLVKGNFEYSLYIGNVQVLESYEGVSITKIIHLADPAVFPVSQYHTVMLGDYAVPFTPPEEGKSKEAPKQKTFVSAQELDAPPPPPLEKEVIRGKEKIVDKVTITNEILFDLNKAELRQEAKEILKDIAEEIRSFGGTVRVEGHTCDIGSEEHNMLLSQKRADAVVLYLVTSEGIPKEKLEAKGLGEAFLLNLSETESEKALNRRVEFKFLEE